jgi:succinate dehydrogenase / fumarate reductase membrane anchor subunit
MSEAAKGQGGTVQVEMMRSALGRARGLGAAKSGAAHWWAQRVTAMALIPLSLWFVCALVHLLGASHDEVLTWVASPVVIVLLLCLLVATFYHMSLGLQVVIEDYVHRDAARIGLLLAVRAVCFVFALVGIVSVLKMGL